ncbi:ferric reductase NAD binding domain-containing protein [Lipomyces arxii]|uniref:ferric reductase NAD binding domain-containing protein n=1 Tax=Lipomyces arxii TaxID=56418 RepID=UPI0034CF87E7
MIYWAGLMFISFCWKMLVTVCPRVATQTSTLGDKIRKHLTLPALFNGEHTAPFSVFGFDYALMPSRGEGLVLMGFFIINFVCLFVDYNLDNNNVYWPDRKDIQLMRYMADRTGIMAFVQTPFLILFGGRNNFLIWLTGWSFQSFMLYHRWIARVMYVNAVLHSVGYTAYGLVFGKETFDSYWGDNYWRWGAVATVIGGLIMLQAAYMFRHRWYEIFLIIHIAFVAVYIVGLWYHCVTLGWMEYVYASIAVWAFDRLVRLIRIFAVGFNVVADVRVIGDIMQLEVRPGFFKPAAKPGQYYYIYVAKLKFWENHPFSLVEVRDGKYVFVAKPMDGMTNKLWNYLESQPQRSAEMRVGLEGPYGEKFLVEPFDTVLLIAGGIGISAMVNYAKTLAAKKREGQHIILYWIMRSDNSLEALKRPMAELKESGLIELHIHVTSSNEVEKIQLEPQTSDSEKNSFDSTPALLSVNYVKPDIEEVIRQVIADANGSVAVAVCGSESLNDASRRATAANVDQAKKRVEYYEEAFAWA